MTYGPGKTVTYTYDSLDRLTGVADWAGHGVTITYHDAARRTVLTRGNNTVRETRRDAAGQVVRITDQLNPVSWNPNPTPLQHIGMNYDGDGRLVRKVELPTQTPTYTPAPTTASYNDDNALVTFNGVTILHDAAGRITSSPAVLPRNPPASVNQTYTWNARGQLTKVVEPGRFDTTYTYNPEGHRISTTHGGQTWHWTVDPVGAGMPRFITRQHQPTGVITHYIYAGDILLYQFEEGGGAVRYYHYDHLGSTVLLTDGEGTATDRFSYSAYGETLSRTGSTDTPFQWLGAYGVQTDVTGLHHMRARYFHARLGRFLSEDPILFAGGQNWYAYAEGNPVMAVDPEGEIAQFVVGALVGVGVQAAIDLATGQRSSFGTYLGAAAGGAVTGGVSSLGRGVAVAIASGVVGGASSSVTRQTVDNGRVDASAVALESLGGAVGGGIGNRVLPSALRPLSNQTKGWIGETTSLVTNVSRGNLPVTSQIQLNAGGRNPIFDWQFRNVFNGSNSIVESKFGTSGLTPAQRAAQPFVPNLSVEKWTYGFWGQVGGAGGGIGGSAGGRK
jgi:RHS repeat-associated protein